MTETIEKENTNNNSYNNQQLADPIAPLPGLFVC